MDMVDSASLLQIAADNMLIPLLIWLLLLYNIVHARFQTKLYNGGHWVCGLRLLADTVAKMSSSRAINPPRSYRLHAQRSSARCILGLVSEMI